MKNEVRDKSELSPLADDLLKAIYLICEAQDGAGGIHLLALIQGYALVHEVDAKDVAEAYAVLVKNNFVERKD